MKERLSGIFATLKRLWKYLKTKRGRLILLFVAMLAANALELAIPFLSGRAVDAIGITSGNVDFSRIFLNCGLMVICFALSSTLSYWLSVGLINLSQQVSYELRKDVFHKLVDLPVKYFDTHPSGDIISRVCFDIDTINSSLSTDLMQVCTSVVTVVGSFIMLLVISPLLSCVFLAAVPLTMLFTGRQVKRQHPLYLLRSEKLGKLNGFVEESISGQRTIRAYGREAEQIERFRERNDAAIEANYRADYESRILGPLVNFINNMSLSFISVFGALLYIAGSISLGNISSFILYSRKFSGPIREAANIITEIQAAVAAAQRVFRLIDEEPEPTGETAEDAPFSPQGDINLQHVKFGYEQDIDILHDLTADVKSGTLTAIVGPTGAGKTTIVNLLMRFYDVSGGRILVDGSDVRDMARKQLRRAYAMVLQDTWLFYGTIYENLAYGSENATLARVQEAAKAAKIHNFIMSLPDGYDTLLSDDSLNISKGQKQLLTIARAMLLDASMLILDEATSNVDTATEIEINEAMKKLMHGKTCFVIAHRLSTIERADLILVMDHGRIVEQGKHEDLLRAGGMYASLYASQFEIR